MSPALGDPWPSVKTCRVDNGGRHGELSRRRKKRQAAGTGDTRPKHKEHSGHRRPIRATHTVTPRAHSRTLTGPGDDPELPAAGQKDALGTATELRTRSQSRSTYHFSIISQHQNNIQHSVSTARTAGNQTSRPAAIVTKGGVNP